MQVNMHTEATSDKRVLFLPLETISATYKSNSHVQTAEDIPRGNVFQSTPVPQPVSHLLCDAVQTVRLPVQTF